MKDDSQPPADSKHCRLKNEIPFLEATTVNEFFCIFPENFYAHVLCMASEIFANGSIMHVRPHLAFFL